MDIHCKTMSRKYPRFLPDTGKASIVPGMTGVVFAATLLIGYSAS
jgi:hypothetical protein